MARPFGDSDDGPKDGPTRPGKPPGVDLAVVRQLRALNPAAGPDVVAELIELFGSTALETIRDLRTALEGRRAADARRLAHSLRGSASTLGATGISILAGRAEELARQERLDEIAPLVDRLAAMLEPTLARLRDPSST